MKGKESRIMVDGYNREIDYMRISITDRCNLRCIYCMPNGVSWVPMADILTMEEICQIAAVGAALGIRHIKVTGGEPLVRKGCCDLVRMLKGISGIEKVTITTNGVLLNQYFKLLLEAGIDGINISLDSREKETYKRLTGTDGLALVMEGLRAAAASSVCVKVNAVSLDLGYDNCQRMLELAREYPVDVRFIEMMPIGCGKQFLSVSHEKLISRIIQDYPGMAEDYRVHGSGPAVYYQIPGFQGSIGFISAIHGKFCQSCNRVRLTAQGFLKTCLCYEDGVDLRNILRGDGSEEEKRRRLEETMKEAVLKKPKAHCFENPEKMTEQNNMIAIGG